MNNLKQSIRPLWIIRSNLIKSQLSNHSKRLITSYLYSPNLKFNKLDHTPLISKRKFKKPKINTKDFKSVIALSTAESYDLEEMSDAIQKQNIYELVEMSEDLEDDVLLLCAKYKVNNIARDIFVFREGSFVCWNCSDEEVENFHHFISDFEQSPYRKSIVLDEREEIDYLITDEIARSKFMKGVIHLKENEKTKLNDQYACSNAIAMSVKLAIWESMLNEFIERIQPITERMKEGKNLKLTREQMFQRTGELFALRHQINLQSDLLDTPDFYWERDQLEYIYQKVFNYLKLSKRTKVMNDKINDCLSLIELVSHHLDDKHHVRLEWMIIVLIMVEVAFECIHYADRF